MLTNENEFEAYCDLRPYSYIKQKEDHLMHFCTCCGYIDKIVKVNIELGSHWDCPATKGFAPVRALKITWDEWDAATEEQKAPFYQYTRGVAIRKKQFSTAATIARLSYRPSCPRCNSTNTRGLRSDEQLLLSTLLFKHTHRCIDCNWKW